MEKFFKCILVTVAITDDQYLHCAAKFYILNVNLPDISNEVPDPKTEVLALESG